MSKNDFFPQGYSTPQSSGGDYTKLEDGDNVIRILSKPLMYWIQFVDSKPERTPFVMGVPPPKQKGKDSVKHAWGLIIWNGNKEKIELYEITQETIKVPIENLAKNDKWGNPFAYDITINKKGKDLETKYNVIPNPKEPVTDAVKKAYKDKPINLQALLTGDNPFEATDEATREYREETPVTETVKEVFKAEEVAKVDESSDLPF